MAKVSDIVIYSSASSAKAAGHPREIPGVVTKVNADGACDLFLFNGILGIGAQHKRNVHEGTGEDQFSVTISSGAAAVAKVPPPNVDPSASNPPHAA
jgi:hypothetical protein